MSPLKPRNEKPIHFLDLKANRTHYCAVKYHFIHPVFIRRFVQDNKPSLRDQCYAELFLSCPVYKIYIILECRPDISWRGNFDLFGSGSTGTCFSKHRKVARRTPCLLYTSPSPRD